MIGGAAPSVFEARGGATIYNPKLRYEVKQAREAARGVSIDGERRREEAVFAWMPSRRCGWQISLPGRLTVRGRCRES